MATEVGFLEIPFNVSFFIGSKHGLFAFSHFLFIASRDHADFYVDCNTQLSVAPHYALQTDFGLGTHHAVVAARDMRHHHAGARCRKYSAAAMYRVVQTSIGVGNNRAAKSFSATGVGVET